MTIFSHHFCWINLLPKGWVHTTSPYTLPLIALQQLPAPYTTKQLFLSQSLAIALVFWFSSHLALFAPCLSHAGSLAWISSLWLLASFLFQSLCIWQGLHWRASSAYQAFSPCLKASWNPNLFMNQSTWHIAGIHSSTTLIPSMLEIQQWNSALWDSSILLTHTKSMPSKSCIDHSHSRFFLKSLTETTLI